MIFFLSLEKQCCFQNLLMIKIIETPRDGMQGLQHLVSVTNKVSYINHLLKCGFHTVEVGSFVSPHAIPQMADTGEVLNAMDTSTTHSHIAVLVVNKKGGERAMQFKQIDRLFYPFSLSPTFLEKNMRTTLAEAEKTIDSLQNRCVGAGKKLVVFLSLAFGNPYGDLWTMDLVFRWVEKFIEKGLDIVPLAETIGDIGPQKIYEVCAQLVPAFPQVQFGLHTHALPNRGIAKVDAAYRAGIRRFDTVLGGLGGCPMTGKKMIANLDLIDLINYCDKKGINTGLDKRQVTKAKQQLSKIVMTPNLK